jgi:fructose-bisphosphate aldolase class 1
VHLGRAAVQRHIHVFEPAIVHETVDDSTGKRRASAIGHEAEVEAERRCLARPAQNFRPHRRLATESTAIVLARALGALIFQSTIRSAVSSMWRISAVWQNVQLSLHA